MVTSTVQFDKKLSICNAIEQVVGDKVLYCVRLSHYSPNTVADIVLISFLSTFLWTTLVKGSLEFNTSSFPDGLINEMIKTYDAIWRHHATMRVFLLRLDQSLMLWRIRGMDLYIIDYLWNCWYYKYIANIRSCVFVTSPLCVKLFVSL